MQARSVKFDVNKFNSVDVCVLWQAHPVAQRWRDVFKKGVAPAVELGVQTWQGTAGNEFLMVVRVKFGSSTQDADGICRPKFGRDDPVWLRRHFHLGGDYQPVPGRGPCGNDLKGYCQWQYCSDLRQTSPQIGGYILSPFCFQVCTHLFRLWPLLLLETPPFHTEAILIRNWRIWWGTLRQEAPAHPPTSDLGTR